MTPTLAMSSSNSFHISVSNSFWRMVSGSGGGTAGGSGENSSSSNSVFCRLDDSRLLCRVVEPSSPVESCLENIDPLLVAPAFPMAFSNRSRSLYGCGPCSRRARLSARDYGHDVDGTIIMLYRYCCRKQFTTLGLVSWLKIRFGPRPDAATVDETQSTENNRTQYSETVVCVFSPPPPQIHKHISFWAPVLNDVLAGLYYGDERKKNKVI